MVGLQLFESLFQRVGTAHEELDRILLLIRCTVHQTEGFFPFAGQPFGTDHLGIAEVCTVFDAKGSEWDIGISCQGCKKYIPWYGDRADLY